jgi:signal transduction histidine kinase
MNLLPTQGQSSFERMNIRLFNQMRAILIFATLLVIYIDPAEPQNYVALTYTTLILYNLYSIALLFFSYRKPDLIPVNYTHWIDVGWCLFLIIISSGTSSIFFFLFFFALLEASFRFGYSEGLRVTFASVLLFTVLGYVAAPAGESFELNRFLLRPVYLGILGYMISFWGGQELRNKRRLAVLKDINRLYNPRFGVDQTIAAILQKILDSFKADSCLLITSNGTSSGYLLRQSYRANPEQAIYAERIENENSLLAISPDYAVIYCGSQSGWFSKKEKYVAFDLESGQRIEEPARNGELLADLLETKAFISVPLQQRGMIAGRIYLTSDTKNFNYSDVEFLSQLLEHAVPVVENVHLLDRLASKATEEQRQKISRDIHDSTVQPYIGLKLGLEALQMKQESGDDITGDIGQLINMANANINDIRSYINKLKTDAPDAKKGSVLVSAIKKQADKLGEFYGIKIEVSADDSIQINDRLSAEVFQIITEGLSNIRRHTKSDHALIIIECDDKKLKLEIQNNNPNGENSSSFIPKSITGRAQSLGGRARVRNENSKTKVSVEIPL